MSSTQKKVVLRRFDGGAVWGYLSQGGFVRDGTVEILGLDGRINPIDVSEIKLIAYVWDFNVDDSEDPERIGRRTFLGRPRGDGLWLRAGFVDGDVLEGLSEAGMALLDTAIDNGGVHLTPPDMRGNAQRVFVPRSALRSLEVLGWVTAPSKRAAARSSGRQMDETQPGLFE